jgi:hypothetical protein
MANTAVSFVSEIVGRYACEGAAAHGSTSRRIVSYLGKDAPGHGERCPDAAKAIFRQPARQLQSVEDNLAHEVMRKHLEAGGLFWIRSRVDGRLAPS